MIRRQNIWLRVLTIWEMVPTTLAIELVTIEEEERNLLIVIHAMKLQKQNMDLLEGDF